MATCSDCVHYEVCKEYGEVFELMKDERCSLIKESSKFVELPCKPGDHAYMLFTKREKDGRKIIERDVVVEVIVDHITIGDADIPCYTVFDVELCNCVEGVMATDFGKYIFLSKEEAERAVDIINNTIKK